MTRKIRQVRERLVYEEPDNQWLKLYFDDVEFPDGTRGRYNRIVENDGRAGVAVVPLRDGHVGLVRLHRYPIGETLWETPRGYADTTEYADEARRELREETGLAAARLHGLGEMLPSTGLSTTRVHLFAAEIAEGAASQPADLHEIEDFAWIPLEMLYERIARGEINDAVTITSVFRAVLRGLIPPPPDASAFEQTP